MSLNEFKTKALKKGKNMTIKNFNSIISAYEKEDLELFKKELPNFKENMEKKLGKKLTDQDCVILIRNIFNLLPKK